MASSYLIFTRQPTREGFLPIHLAASNGDFAGSTEASLYWDEFKFFAEQLKTFPRTPTDKVRFSSGGDDDAWSSYLYLEIYPLEGEREAVLQVRLRRNEPDLQAGGAAFSITATRAAINQLGLSLSTWLSSDAERLEVSI